MDVPILMLSGHADPADVERGLQLGADGYLTKPFVFEGSQRRSKASGGIAELAKCVDALIVIPNDRLITLAGMKMTLKDAFAKWDAEWLARHLESVAP